MSRERRIIIDNHVYGHLQHGSQGKNKGRRETNIHQHSRRSFQWHRQVSQRELSILAYEST